MTQSIVKQRNGTVDSIRGIAMLLVVLGHTISGCTENFENSFLYNIIWTLQMPLFMIISGYTNKYGKPVTNVKSLGVFLLKKTQAYLLPFAVWTFLVRGIVFQQIGYLDIKKLIFNMDNGYWFLFSIWTITIICGIANFLSESIFKKKKEYMKLAGTTIFYLCGMAVLVVIGYFMGLSFLCIKLTLYYMPFYYAGYLYGKLDVGLTEIKFFAGFKDAVIALSLIAWVFLMNRYNFYEIDEGAFEIILRAIASLLGCVAVCGLISALLAIEGMSNNIFNKLLLLSGKYSLEIYLSHYLLLSMVKPKVLPAFSSPSGVLLTVANYVLTLVTVFIVISLVKNSKTLNIILFGKNRK